MVILCVTAALCATVRGNAAKRDPSLAYVFTAAPQYEPKAWLDGRDRFPEGAKLVAVIGGMVRILAPGFYGSADPAVSFDATRVLFSGKRTPADHWQIWEVDLQGGSPVQLTECDSDCFRPLYLPDPTDGFVYSRGDRLEIGSKSTRITFAP